MAHAKSVSRAFVSGPDKYILLDCKTKPTANGQLKPLRCSGQRDALAQCRTLQATLTQNGPFILTFEDQVTVEVLAIHGIYDRAADKWHYNNAHRYFVVCEIELD
jgi:hypothetical protein